jgi:hypothetical protein
MKVNCDPIVSLCQGTNPLPDATKVESSLQEKFESAVQDLLAGAADTDSRRTAYIAAYIDKWKKREL